MSSWFGKIAVLVHLLGYVFIRWPHGNRSATVKVVENRRGGLETGLLLVAMLTTTLLPVLWLTTRLLAFADYPLRPGVFWPGVALMLAGLYVFHRSHADLGTNWSITLQVRENHSLVTSGVYSKVRHPMYSAMMLGALAQILILPNWVAGPAYLVGFGLLYVLRVSAEERMMLDKFCGEYEAYMKKTARLVPGLG
ncbi:MAG: isoprenylcysteine carboxylmethyltransferase family protein [Elusimicrobia bacterium]|nr:isoprenylcysteine carboxylmethyltransferase family protein [Elusimicrobiota bacterium]